MHRRSICTECIIRLLSPLKRITPLCECSPSIGRWNHHHHHGIVARLLLAIPSRFPGKLHATNDAPMHAVDSRTKEGTLREGASLAHSLFLKRTVERLPEDYVRLLAATFHQSEDVAIIQARVRVQARCIRRGTERLLRIGAISRVRWIYAKLQKLKFSI